MLSIDLLLIMHRSQSRTNGARRPLQGALRHHGPRCVRRAVCNWRRRCVLRSSCLLVRTSSVSIFCVFQSFPIYIYICQVQRVLLALTLQPPGTFHEAINGWMSRTDKARMRMPIGESRDSERERRAIWLSLSLLPLLPFQIVSLLLCLVSCLASSL